MNAEAVEAPRPVILTRDEAARLSSVLRGLTAAASGLGSGRRSFTAEEFEALKTAALRVMSLVYMTEYGPADVIDLDRERARRRP